jgi:RHS repeat-associated protein
MPTTYRPSTMMRSDLCSSSAAFRDGCKFTGKERDSESGLDNFGARYNASSLGRFMSPDPKIPSMKHLINPQKWNKYAYVLNNPLALVDPDGLEEVTVTIRAYIPQQSFRFPPVVGPTWKGDGPAGHGRNATSYRVQATVKIETDQSVRKSSNPVVSVSGDTTGSSVNWYGLGTQTGRSNVSATASGTYDQNGNAVVQIKVSGSDPLVPGAPAAAGTFSVSVPEAADQITTSGTITPYPNWEGYASSQSGGQATLFQTSGSPDDTPANLVLGQSQSVASSARLVNDQPQTGCDVDRSCKRK